MQCTDNSWKTGSRCEFGCNASTGECYAEQSVCTENARQCNGSSIDVCRSNKWEREDTCKFGCSAGNCNTEEAACKTGSKQCNGSYPQSCLDSKWVDGTICQYGCKDGACNDSLVECSPGAKQCNGAYVQTCSSSSKWTTAASACTYGCTNGACNESVTECTTGAVQCNGSTVQKCSASGKWANSESCTFGCTNGICNVELRNCEEGEVKCNGAYVQTCKDNTIVLASAPCDYGCSGGKCLEATKICTPGAKKCNGLLVQTCKSDGLAWSVDESCSAGCTDGVCENACESGAVTCEGKQPKKCSVLSSGNVWVNDGSACTYGCEASTGSCTSAKACTGLTTIDNGNSGCVDSSNYGTCSNGSWTSKKSCAGGCISNTCYAVCKPNAQECVSASSIKICKSDGSGWETSSCPSAASICDSTTKTCRAPGNCTIGGKIVASGSKGCDGQKVYSCSDGKSSEVTTCSSSQNCSNGACVNKGQCTSYYSKAVSSELMGCVSDTAYDLCNDGSWLGADTACTTTVANALPVCDSTKEGGNSAPCSFKCKSGYTLKDGVCVGNPCTDYEGNTIESDTFGCSSSTIYHACVGGAWSSDAALSEVCTTDKDNATAVCKNKECTFECNAGYTLTDGACVSSGACVSTPASVKSSDLKSSFGTKTNSYAATAEYTIPSLTGVTASIKGNYNSSNNYLYLRHTDSSYITVATLPCISKVTINTKYQKTGVKLTVTAGSYSEQKTVPSSFTDLVFEVTDSSATSFTISESGTVSSAAIVSSFGWE